MKNLKRMCAAVALTCALAVAASAGDISAGGVTSPPPPPPQSATEATAQGHMSAPEATAEGDMSAGLMAVLLSLLSVF